MGLFHYASFELATTGKRVWRDRLRRLKGALPRNQLHLVTTLAFLFLIAGRLPNHVLARDVLLPPAEPPRFLTYSGRPFR